MATSSLSSSKGSFIWLADPPTITGGITLLNNQLWNGVNQSQKWHNGVFYTLSSAYALVALIALGCVFCCCCCCCESLLLQLIRTCCFTC
ncbi:hypothetical protein HanPI659440_Chr16g0640421 [Helianthus annuus]|nr:hypothetical protein HanPI659440_Chr16g0640421 [Helianthus annuus]